MKRATLFVMALTVCMVAEVATADFTFGEPTNLVPTVNSQAIDGQSSVSADGLSLFFYSERSGGYGGRDIWIAARATTDGDWTPAENLGPPVNTSYRESAPSVSADGLMLFFDSDRGGSGDEIWMTTRQTTDDPWTTSVVLEPPVNSSAEDGSGRISPDGLALFFASRRSGGYGGGWNAWVATRATTDGNWGTPTNLGPTINLPGGAAGAIPSADGSTLHFTTLRSGSGDLWQAPIIRIVDFNGDGSVDSVDMCIMVDYWHTDEPLCDIGPMPWGDGVVDVEDLKLLAEHLFEDVDDPTLVAHWALDEDQATIAHDDGGDCDGALVGDPIWQPDGGMVGGALDFDGIDDHVSTDFVLNPADGAFSVLAWVKGGAPGQVILSQQDGVSWLMTDAADGALRTDLKRPAGSGRGALPEGPPLICSTVVTDGDWHRVVFVRDGTDRILYVDDTEAARDAAESLEAAYGGLHIGAGSASEPDTFFSGLIDDVRIYNRAIRP